ncbi:MAG: hypothetical protein KME13_26395 [Myxacorys californica WJT36-NPBG1]|jgi:hypothetical protein|nr:hypothetical protein [Myxacorys californica WJT36-NPBG1]
MEELQSDLIQLKAALELIPQSMPLGRAAVRQAIGRTQSQIDQLKRRLAEIRAEQPKSEPYSWLTPEQRLKNLHSQRALLAAHRSNCEPWDLVRLQGVDLQISQIDTQIKTLQGDAA